MKNQNQKQNIESKRKRERERSDVKDKKLKDQTKKAPGASVCGK